MLTTKNKSRAHTRKKRRGAAVVETALCLPVIVILMFATLEICAGIYLKESLSIAAYEGARTGVKRRSTRAQVISRVEDILAARNVTLGSGGRITVAPTDLSTLDILDPITVTITAPTADNSAFVFNHLANRNITATVKMAREFDH